MAQGFYNAQEACAKLKKTEDELRKLVRDGQLREFRDARGVMYRAAEVDALAGPADDSVAELTLADSAAPAPAAPVAPAKPATPPPAAPAKGDTNVFNLDAATEADAAKTDVFSLEPAGEGSEEKKGGSGSGSSISLLDDLENITIPADPMAETVVSSAELEGASGGSGLLDLARESDDTSLGAELYDESAEGEAPAAGGSGSGSAVALPAAASSVAAAPAAPMDYYVAPAAAEVTDPMAPAFIAMSVVGLIALLVAGLAAAAAVMDSWPGLLDMISSVLWIYTLAAFVLAGAAWGIGWMLGKQALQRRAAFSRAAGGAEGPEGA